MDINAVNTLVGLAITGLTVYNSWILSKIDNKLLRQKDEILKEINGIYVRSNLCEERHSHFQDKINDLKSLIEVRADVE